MKAVFVNHYSSPHQVVIHKDVVEMEKTHGRNREFRCKCCGLEWIENINSPQILSDEVANNLEKYYGHDELYECSKVCSHDTNRKTPRKV